MRELDTGVVVGQDVVIAVLAAVGGKLCYRARLLRGHLDGAKLLQEQLVVVGAHHQKLVDEDVDGHWGVGLQRLRVVVSSVLLHGVSGLVATATRDAYRAAALEAVGGAFELRVRAGERGSRGVTPGRHGGSGSQLTCKPLVSCGDSRQALSCRCRAQRPAATARCRRLLPRQSQGTACCPPLPLPLGALGTLGVKRETVIVTLTLWAQLKPTEAARGSEDSWLLRVFWHTHHSH